MLETKNLPNSAGKRQLFRALEAKSLRNRSRMARISDELTGWSSTPTFLFLNLSIFIIWIVLNSGIVPQFTVIDPFPFSLLTMVVSLEAIMLSIFVLISQNRAAQIATLREELHLRINLIAEQEITKILEILADMRKDMGITKKDPELMEMIQDINTTNLEQSISEQIQRADQPVVSFKKREFTHLIAALLNPKKTTSKD